MSEKKQTTLVPTRGAGDSFALLRQMTSELDRAFQTGRRSAGRPSAHSRSPSPLPGLRRSTSSRETTAWSLESICRA